jgi:hypothetical protein
MKKYNRDFIKAFLNYATIKPFDLTSNYLSYKFIGTKVIKVCECCYYNSRQAKRLAVDKLIKGQKVPRLPRSKTKEEILEYFTDMNNYRNRKDRKEYQLNKKDLTLDPVPGLLFISMYLIAVGIFKKKIDIKIIIIL